MADRSDNRRRTPWLVTAFLWLGIGLLAVALVLVAGKQRMLAGSKRAPGTVSAVSSEAMRDYNGRFLGGGYRIAVSFADDSGQRIEVRSPITSSSTSWRVGDAVAVDYPPGHPERAVIATFADRWLAPLIVGGIGAMAVLIGGLGVWMARQPGTRFQRNGAGGFVMTLGGSDPVRPGRAAPPE